MKLFLKLTVLVALIWSSTNYAQTAGFSYQALILDTSTIEVPSTDIQPQIPLDNERVELRFTIEYSIGGVPFTFTEVHSSTTGENGMVQVIVGQGVPLTTFTFDEIIWDGKEKLLTVELNIIDSTTGFIPLDTQEILYIPHPSNPLDIFLNPSKLLTLTDKKQGDIVWVEDADGSINADLTNNPSLFILAALPNTWVPVAKDFDPENEQSIITVPTLADRSSRFLPAPLAGDQVYIIDQDFIQVFNGISWVTILSEMNLSATNGLNVNPATFEVELGGPLTQPATSIDTTPTNTLAITGLQPAVADLSDDVIVSDASTEVLKKISFDDIFLQKAINLLDTPLDIATLPTTKKEGDLIWVRNFDGNINPTLLIFDSTSTGPFSPWIPVTKDFDPDNERNLKTLVNTTERDLFFSPPQTGDQVFIEQFNLIQVYDGVNWINSKSIVPVADDVERDNVFPAATVNIGDQVFITGNNTLQVFNGPRPVSVGDPSGWINVVNASNIDVENGLFSDLTDVKLKLGGPLTQPTTITTDPTAATPLTLAIANLENKLSILDDGFVLADPTTGVLSTISAADFLVENSVQIYPTLAALVANPVNKTGDLAWVLEFRNPGTPAMFIYDSTGTWTPIFRNSKLFEYPTEALRDLEFITTSGQAGDQTYITGVGVQVFDGANWVTLLSNSKTEITTNLTTLAALPIPEIGVTVWVEDADGSNNSSLYIYDNTGTWVPVNNDFDPENEKLIVVADDLERLVEFGAIPPIGAQVFNQTSKSIEIWDGTFWISASNSTLIVILPTDLPTIPTPDRGATAWVENADGNNNPSLFIFNDVTNSWLPIHNEFKLAVVADNAARFALFGGMPEIGTQVFNQTTQGLEVWDGTTWVSASNSTIIVTLPTDLPLTPTPDIGTTIWVEDADGKNNPSLYIFDNTSNWVTVHNEFKIAIVADDAERDLLTTVAGDQVFNQDTESIEIWDGSAWVSPSKATDIFSDVASITPSLAVQGTLVMVNNYLTEAIPTLVIYNGGSWVPAANYTQAASGLTIDPATGILELGGLLTGETRIETTTTETLAIEGLVLSADPVDNFVVVDAAGVLKQKSLDEILEKPSVERFDTSSTLIDNTTANFRIEFNTEGIAPDVLDYVTSSQEITVVEPGDYKITYRVTAEITSLDATDNTIDFALFTEPGFGTGRTIVPGSVSSGSFNAVNDKITATATRIITLAAGISISVGSNIVPTSSAIIQRVIGGSSLLVEFIRE